MARRAIYPGSFDVLTHGHVDIIERSASLFDELIVGVGDNPKKRPLFSSDERLEMLAEATRHLPHVSARAYHALTVDFAIEHRASVIVRGLRFVSDFEFELQIAMANAHLAPGIETVFLAPSARYSYVSSAMVKQLAYYGRDVTAFVPEHVASALRTRLAQDIELDERVF